MLYIEAANVARNTDFRLRVDAFMVKAALANLSAETPSSGDLLLGQRILKGDEPVGRWALGCMVNPTFLAGAHDPDGSTIVDGDLEFTVNSLWGAFAK